MNLIKRFILIMDRKLDRYIDLHLWKRLTTRDVIVFVVVIVILHCFVMLIQKLVRWVN